MLGRVFRRWRLGFVMGTYDRYEYLISLCFWQLSSAPSPILALPRRLSTPCSPHTMPCFSYSQPTCSTLRVLRSNQSHTSSHATRPAPITPHPRWLFSLLPSRPRPATTSPAFQDRIPAFLWRVQQLCCSCFPAAAPTGMSSLGLS